MPRHQHVTTCLKGGGPVSKFCSCPHCTLGVCAVCGAYEGGLTTDCPGEAVSFDRQQEVYETNLDFSDERGWHQGESMKHRSPRFAPQPRVATIGLSATKEHTPLLELKELRIQGCSCGWRTPPGTTDSDDAFSLHAAQAATIGEAWAKADRVTDLQHDLAKKAIAWVLADRIAEEASAALTHAKAEVDACLAADDVRRAAPRENDQLTEAQRAAFARHESVKIDFHRADQKAVARDNAFRQAARLLVAELEKGT